MPAREGACLPGRDLYTVLTVCQSTLLERLELGSDYGRTIHGAGSRSIHGPYMGQVALATSGPLFKSKPHERVLKMDLMGGESRDLFVPIPGAALFSAFY